jgi:ADP-heptose:LPS heptosyltransferase
VLTLDRARYRGLNPISICAQTFALLRHLRRGRHDLVVDFQGFGETGLLAWLSGAPHRWGSVYHRTRSWAYTRAVWRNWQLHPVDYNVELLRLAGGLIPARICNEFAPPESTLDEARRLFSDAKLDPHWPTLYVQPFTSTRRKNWPLENYIATAHHWRQRGLQVFFGGGPGDRAALEPARQAGFAVIAGAPLLVSASLVHLSKLVLGGDTGLVHLAVAMGKRVIMIMRSVHPGACFPFGHREWAVLPPDGLSLATLAPEAVNQACIEALAGPTAA